MYTIVNVAEKPSVAKQISGTLSKGQYQNIFSDSKFNPVHQFQYNVRGRDCIMQFTSVTGHVMGIEFPQEYKNWRQVDPLKLLQKDTQVIKAVSTDKQNLAKNIERYFSNYNQFELLHVSCFPPFLLRLCRNAQMIILWLDCDREGENIAFEVVQIAQKGQRNIEILRATFSSLEFSQISRALQNLNPPDERKSLAVDARMEIDLRIGAAFTRFQTLNLQNKFQETSNLISYGPCQFPTLGFVVDRFREIRDFKVEKCWYINCGVQWQDIQNKTQITKFSWSRGKLFDKAVAAELYIDSSSNEQAGCNPVATVVKMKENRKEKWKPVPLATITFQKLGTSKLRISAAQVMDVAEKLYQKGFISYPRTETDQFPTSMNDGILRELIQKQTQSPDWGNYADQLLNGGKYQYPRKGKHNDNAHPPIHPTKLLTRNESENELQYNIYQLITRHFLAVCSKNAIGDETNVEILVGEEHFYTKGLIIKEFNWLEVFPYERWSESNAPNLQLGQVFQPQIYKLEETSTSPPQYLTEKDLLTLMDKYGIGTDATMHEHIKTVQERHYVYKENLYFKPSKLGVSLVETYENMEHPLGQPDLRAWMEEKMGGIAEGRLQKDQVIDEVLNVMIVIFQDLLGRKQEFLEKVGETLTRNLNQQNMQGVDGDNQDLQRNGEMGTCGFCSQNLQLFIAANGLRKLVCENCDKQYITPKNGDLVSLDIKCPLCQFSVLKIMNTVNNTSYTLCPNCYCNPPPQFNIEEMTMACYKCKNSECELAQGYMEQIIFNCPQCRGGMKVKSIPGSKFVTGCQNYPNCKYCLFIPSQVKKIIPQNTECQQCKMANRKVLQVKLEFKDENGLPDSVLMKTRHEGQNSLFCLYPNCDRYMAEMGYIEYKKNNTGVQQQQQIQPNRTNQNLLSNFQNTGGQFPGNKRTLTTSFDTLQLNNNAQQQGAVKCYRCNQEGHMSRDCPNNKGTGSTCFKCNQPGHYANNCPNKNVTAKSVSVPHNNIANNNSNSNSNSNNNNYQNKFDKNKKGGFKCFTCGDPGHQPKDCPQKGKGKTDQNNNFKKKGCQFCGKLRHNQKDNCQGKQTRKGPNKNQSNGQYDSDFEL